MSYLRVENLQKKQKDFFLHVKKLEVKEGSFFGVLGHSGAGKSTLLNLLCGLEKKDEGSIFLANKDISTLFAYEREIAYVFQNSLLFEHLNVWQNLEYLLKAKGIEKSKHESLIEKGLKASQAFELRTRDVTTLSGGEKQRVALGAALMFEPKLLLLDEPFSNLDTTLKVKMRKFLKSLVKTHNLTVVMVTHDRDDAYELFDEMLILERGKIIQQGKVKDIYEKPTSVKSAEFFGIENIFRGKVQKGVFTNEKIILHVNLQESDDVSILIPYEAIRFEVGSEYMVQSSIFTEGRWKNELENSLVFYSNEELSTSVNIDIDTTKILKLEN